MEAKEKAKELVEKYIYSMPMLVHQTREIVNEYAKELSKMTVNEIILHNYEHLEGDKYYDRLNELEELIKQIDDI